MPVGKETGGTGVGDMEGGGEGGDNLLGQQFETQKRWIGVEKAGGRDRSLKAQKLERTEARKDRSGG